MDRGDGGKKAAGGLAVCIGIAAVLGISSIRIVPPANVGIEVTLGSIADDYLGSGLHFTNPLASVTNIATKTNLLEQANHVPTKEGVTVELDVAVLYHVEASSARSLFLNIGDNFEAVVIAPELASAVRGLTSEVDASALYTSGRQELQMKLQSELTEVLTPRGIQVESVLLKGVVLPDLLKESIEKKAQAEQDAARMQFVLQKETQEAERKKIEAGGIADFQRIVSAGLSPEMLMWKGVEATHEIAVSPNAKVIMVGNQKDGLPVILGGDTSATPASMH